MQTGPILAFDCATSPATVALRMGDRIETIRIEHGAQASQFVPAIDRLLRAENIAYTQLACIVTTTGPGSFTGLRIALAALHGLVLAHPTPLRLLNTCEAVALEIAARPDAPTQFIIALDAGKQEFFAQAFQIEAGIVRVASEITTHPFETINQLTLPTFSNLYAADHTHFISGPNAAVLAQFAEQIPEKKLGDAVPFYIRPADAKLPNATI